MTPPATTLKNLGALAQDATRLSAAEWAEAHPSPVLVLEPFTPETDESFMTGRHAAAEGTTVTVAELDKRRGANAFSSMITIGRAANNDVVLAANGVSKFHAYVTIAKRGEAPVLVDAGSSNGTRVNGQTLKPRLERASLADGAELTLGALRAVFYSPAGLYAALRSGALPARFAERAAG